MTDENEPGSDSPNLEIILKANGVDVARSTDPAIWLSAMASITGGAPMGSASPIPMRQAPAKDQAGPEEEADLESRSNSLVEEFADDLELDLEILQGAADPSFEAPYIHLEAKYWEAFKRTPGYGRISPTVLVATLLLLWGRHHKEIGDLGTKDCAPVFAAIGLSDKNPTRGIRNCDWLQLRGKVVKLNPSMISQAEKVASAYCASRS